MPKQLNVNLSFTADTQKAKQQLQDLQNYLTRLTQSAGKTSPLGLTEDINSAILKVTELQGALQRATTSSGSLDLGQFHQELNKANLDAKQIAASLSALGPEGQAAFAKIAQSVSMAEMPIKRTNTLLMEFATTLKNTARWQLSSSVLHGFMGSVQSAYRYAQDLNKSLNDIRIVTGQTTEQMTEFAKQANESAKALSSTTTAYTDAALIFYQQGLGEDAVKERTDAVIKMSNVTGEAVKDVSSYMTAIWNNFDDGSESLEHYADVITALGAATASSSEEIAGGLEKFASIGSTVGLSYDYATAALATVVSATRQSEDVVGTAFKTIFSRIQGLKLGETLEDDVDLNKYSSALKAVGVEVVDATGELRDLDNILDDLADKWDLLTGAQQTALAQTVAGTRQYAQFIALMSNWDFMEKNLEIAKNSEGALQEQADIYAESWEAARKRVKASAQAIYDDLLDDEFFIKLSDGFSKVLDGIHNVIKSIGGLKGVLPVVSSLFLKMFGNDLTNSINNFIYNIQLMSKKGRQAIIDTRKEFNDTLVKMKTEMEDFVGSDFYAKRGELQNQIIEKTVQLNSLGKELTESEKQQLDYLLDINNAYMETAIKSNQELENIQKQNAELKTKAILQTEKIEKGNKESLDYSSQDLQNQLKYLQKVQVEWAKVTQLKEEFFKASENGGDAQAIKQLKKIRNEIENLVPVGDDGIEVINAIENALDKLASGKIGDVDKAFIELEDVLNRVGTDGFEELINGIKGTDSESKRLKETLKALQNGFTAEGISIAKAGKDTANFNNSLDLANKTTQQFKGTITTFSQAIVAAGQGFSSFAMYLNSIHSFIDSITNPDLSGIERLTTIMMSLGMMVNGFTSTAKNLGTVVSWLNGLFDVSIAKQKEKITLDQEEAIWNKVKIVSDEAAGKQIASLITKHQLLQVQKGKLTKEELILQVAEKNGIKIRKNQIMLTGALAGKESALTEAIIAHATATKGATTANEGLKASLMSNPYGWILLVIGAIVAGLSAWATHTKKVREEQIEANKAEIERINKIQEEVNANQELIKQYNELFDAYKDGQKTKEDLYDITDKLVEKYNLEGAALAKLTGNYDALTTSIENASKNELKNTIKESEIEISKFEDQFSKTNDKNNFGTKFIDIFARTIANAGVVTGQNANISASDWNKRKLELKSKNNLDEKVLSKGNIKDIFDYQYNNIESIVKTYDELKDQLAILKNTYNADFLSKITIDDQMETFIAKWDEDVKQYKASLKELEEYEAQLEVLNINPEEVNNLDDYDKAIEDVTQALVGQRIEQERANELAEIYLAQRSSEFKGYQEEKQLISDLKTEWNNLSEAELRNIVTSGKYSEEQLRMLVSLNINPSPDEDLQQYLDNINAKLKIEHFDINSEALNAALDDLTKDKKISDDVMTSLQNSFPDFDWESFGTETYINQLEIINDLLDQQNKLLYEGYKEQEEISPELAKQREEEIRDLQKRIELKEKEIQDLQKYTGEDSISTKRAQEELTKLQQKLTEILESDSFNFEADYLNVIEKTYENHVNSIISAAEAAKSAAELIGEGFKVAAEDAQALFDVYPELYDQATVAATGEIELNQQVVEAVLNGNSEVIKSNRQVAIDELKQKIKLTEAQMNYYKLQMDAISKYLSGEVDKNETEQTLDKNTADFKENLNKTLIENQIKDAEQAANANTEMARIACGNIAKIGTEAEELGKVLNAALAGHVYKGSFNKDGLGGNITQYSNLNYKPVDEVVARDGAQYISEMQKQMEQLSALYESASKEDAYYKNLLSKLYAENSEYDAAIAGIGKGKGSGSSKQDAKDLKNFFDEFDRFYPIVKAIEDVTDALSDLDKQQSHLSGKVLINSLEKENQLLEEQKALYENLLTEQEKYRNELAGGLASFGATFDAETGNITNYSTLVQNAVNQFNAAVVAYNSSAQDEIAKNAFSAAEKNYNTFKDLLSKYQNILKDVEDTSNNLDDIYYKQIENNLEQFNVEIQLNLDIEEAKRKLNDFIKDINTDFKKLYKTTKEWTDLFALAESNIKSYTGENGTIATDLEALKEITDIIDNQNYDYGSPDSLFTNRTEAIEKYKELSDQIMSDSKDLYSLYESAWDEYLNAIDEAGDQWADILSGFSEVNDTLDHYAKITELLYGGDGTSAGRDYLKEIYQQQLDISLLAQSTLKEEISAYQKELDELIAQGADENDEDVRKITEQIKDANNQLSTEIENYIEVAQNKFLNAVNSIMDAADKAITKDVGINKVIERWNDAKEVTEGYYDSVEKVYQLEKLESEWEDTLNSTSSLKSQQYLKTLMDAQLKNLKDKTTLSEYDIELAEKELAIYKAQMALEDARNNKNSMKLVRNQQGNWSYQYVADSTDISNKKQDFTDALYDRYEFVKSSSEKATEALLNLQASAQQRLTALMEEYKTADGDRRKEIEGEYDYLYNHYYGPDGVITRESAATADKQRELDRGTMDLLWGLYETDKSNYENMTKDEQGLIDTLRDNGVTSFETLQTKVAGENGFYEQIDQKASSVVSNNQTEWQNAAKDIVKDWADESNPDSVQKVITDAYNDIQAEVEEYDKDIEKSQKISGAAWGNVKDALDKVKLSEDAVLNVLRDIENTKLTTDKLSTYKTTVDGIGTAWSNVKTGIDEALSSYNKYIEALKEEVTIPSIKHESSTTPTGGGNTSSGAGSGDNTASSNTPNDSSLDKGRSGKESWDAEVIVNGQHSRWENNIGKSQAEAETWAEKNHLVPTGTGSDSNHPHYIICKDQTYYDDIIEEAQEKPKNSGSSSAAHITNPKNSSNTHVVAMASGGYTGDWNSTEGRLAILHEKELVLNKEDTSKLLGAVNIVRSITSGLGGSISSIVSNGIAGIASSVNNIVSPNRYVNSLTNNNANTENVFNIEAVFPNAADVEEIREAILSLPNLASQYLSQK